MLFAVVMLMMALAPVSVLAQDAATAGYTGPITVTPVCNAAPQIGFAECLSVLRTDSGASISANGTPSGFGPSDLQDAYNVSDNGAVGTGPLVAIVDAYHDPSAEADMNIYRQQFGIGECHSGPTNGDCFQQVDQNGGTNFPSANRSWSMEISLDLDMVSAICPSCRILLVEADNSSLVNLGTAVNTAVSMGAVAVSNSYGGPEFFFEGWAESQFFNHPGVALTVSSGDNGYGVEFPAASQYVTAVGGTTLNRSVNGRGWSETVWKGAGSGCSRFIAKPAWQTDTTTCSHRTVADVSAVADPQTGVAVYDSFGTWWQPHGWLVFGGTSVSSPIIGSMYALAGHTGSNHGAATIYSHPGSFYDVTSGSNGTCKASAAYLCKGATGYDGPTGVGTPNGLGGF